VRLRELLRGQHAEGEAGVHQIGGQRLGRMDAALDHLAEADLLGMGDALCEGLEDPALEQVGSVHRVPLGPQLLSESDDARREALGVMEQDDFGHGDLQALPQGDDDPSLSSSPGTAGAMPVKRLRRERTSPRRAAAPRPTGPA